MQYISTTARFEVFSSYDQELRSKPYHVPEMIFLSQQAITLLHRALKEYVNSTFVSGEQPAGDQSGES